MATAETVTKRTGRRFGLSSPGLVLATSIVSTLIIVGTFAFFALRDRQQAELEAERMAANTAAVLAENAGRLFEVSDLVISQAGKLTSADGDDLPRSRASHDELRALRGAAPYILSVWISDDAGDAVLTSEQFPAPRVNAGERAYYQVPREEPDALFIGLLPTNRFDQRPLISMSRRLPGPDEAFRGVAHVAVSPEYIQSLYGNLGQGYRTSFWLVRSDTTPLLREPALNSEELIEADLSEAFAPISGTILGSFTADEPVTGDERLFAYRKVPGYDVQVLVGISTDDIDERAQERLRSYAWLGLAALVTIAGLSFMAWQRAFREQEVNQLLESHVRERTAELEDALAQKDVLFREVNHRVKNSLQIVGSLLHLQQRNVEDPEARTHFAEAYGRVLTIARVHERLYKTDRVQSVAFGDYLKDLCEDIEASTLQSTGGTQRIRVEAENVLMPTDLVVSLALIVNELVTNALKYAYAETEEGRIDVTAKRTATDRLRLQVRDFGRGLPDAFDLSSGNMGMSVVMALGRQLDAEITAENAAPGARFVIDMPLVEPKEEG